MSGDLSGYSFFSRYIAGIIHVGIWYHKFRRCGRIQGIFGSGFCDHYLWRSIFLYPHVREFAELHSWFEIFHTDLQSAHTEYFGYDR